MDKLNFYVSYKTIIKQNRTPLLRLLSGRFLLVEFIAPIHLPSDEGRAGSCEKRTMLMILNTTPSFPPGAVPPLAGKCSPQLRGKRGIKSGNSKHCHYRARRPWQNDNHGRHHAPDRNGVRGKVTMDSDALEKERGITIYSKNTSIFSLLCIKLPPSSKRLRRPSRKGYKDTKINIVDTPGHADFGSKLSGFCAQSIRSFWSWTRRKARCRRPDLCSKNRLNSGSNRLSSSTKLTNRRRAPKIAQEEVLNYFWISARRTNSLISRLSMPSAEKGSPKEIWMMFPKTSLRFSIRSSKKFRRRLPIPIKRLFGCSLSAWDMTIFWGASRSEEYMRADCHRENVCYKRNLTARTRKGKIIKMFTFEGIARKEMSKARAGTR